MKRIAALAAILFAGLALTANGLARQSARYGTRAATTAAQPDQVIQWNQELLQLVQVPGAQPATIHPTRTLAITAADQGNPDTVGDQSWVPVANTANDPAYPGAHAEFSRAAATVLENFFGSDSFAFSLTNASTGITRSFQRFSQAADEASASRIFAGQHFRSDEDAGQALGEQVADSVLDNALVLARPTGGD